MSKPIHARRLASAFSACINNELTSEQMKHVRAHCATNNVTCATHEHCDANILMDESFRLVFGRHFDVLNPDDISLVNAAWDLARNRQFPEGWEADNE